MLGPLRFGWLASCIFCVLSPQADPWGRGGVGEAIRKDRQHTILKKNVQYEIKQECISVGCVPPARYRTGGLCLGAETPWTETPQTELDQHQTCKPMMVSIVSSSPTEGNFIFLRYLGANFVQKCQICVIYENFDYLSFYAIRLC